MPPPRIGFIHLSFKLKPSIIIANKTSYNYHYECIGIRLSFIKLLWDYLFKLLCIYLNIILTFVLLFIVQIRRRD